MISGVDNPTIYEDIIKEDGTVLLSGSISIAVGYDNDTTTSSESFTITPTDELGSTLYIQYPDFSSIAGEDFSATETEKDFYRQSDGLYHHPSDHLVRKYAVKAATYHTGNIYNVFPDTPNEVAYNTYKYVNELLYPKYPKGFPYTDVFLLEWVDQGLLDIGKPYAPEPYYPPTHGHMCIEHAYLFTSLTRTLGLPSRELTSGLANNARQTGPIVWDLTGYVQEAAAQVWYDNDWHFFDPFYGYEHIDNYLLGHIAYRSWYAFSEQVRSHDFKIYRNDGTPFKPSQWKHLEDGHQPGLIIISYSPVTLWIADEHGRRVGTTIEGVVNEIPGSIYIAPHTVGYEDASDPTSTFELNEAIFIPDTSLSANNLLFVTGTATGHYAVMFAMITYEGITNVASYEGETVEGAIYVYAIDTTEEALTVEPDPVAELEHLKDFIGGLPDDSFDQSVRRADYLKKALFNKIDEVILKVEAGNYTDAINKLFYDIMAKMDGDSTAKDWIIDPETQSDLCVIIDHIISSIETLEQE